MSEWGWVAAGYGVVYATVAIYAVRLAWRLGAARRRLGDGHG